MITAQIPKRTDAMMVVYDGGIEGDLIGQFDGSDYTVKFIPSWGKYLITWNGAHTGPAARQKMWVDTVEWI